MKSEEYTPTPEEMKTAEQMMTPEQRLASDMREKFSREDFGSLEPISEQRDKGLREEIDNVAGIFQKAELPWFIGGGTALELHTGKLQRDHRDHDVFIWKNDVQKFVKQIRNSRYQIFHITHGNEDTEATEQQILSETNLHLKKADGKGAYIDLWILQEADDTEDLSLSRNSFDNAKKFVTSSGKEVVLENREALILNKVFGAKQLDFIDLIKYLPTLSQEERERLNGYLESVGATFTIGGRETQNLEELLQLADAATREIKENFLATKIDDTISKNKERYDTAIKKIFVIANRVGTSENFLQEIEVEFGKDLVARRKGELGEAAKFLFGDNKPTQVEFREFAYRALNLRQVIEEELKTAALSTERWKVRTEGKYEDKRG